MDRADYSLLNDHEKSIASQRLFSYRAPRGFKPPTVLAFKHVWVGALGFIEMNPVEIVKYTIALIPTNRYLFPRRRFLGRCLQGMRRAIVNMLYHVVAVA